jgi:hypothetical protein
MPTAYRRGAKPFLFAYGLFYSVFEDTKEGQGGAMGATKGGAGAIRGAMWRNGGALRPVGLLRCYSHGKKAKNPEGRRQIDPPPLEKKVVSGYGLSSPNRYIAQTLRVSDKFSIFTLKYFVYCFKTKRL